MDRFHKLLIRVQVDRHLNAGAASVYGHLA